MSKIEVDAIDKQSGSTLTLGGSGTAVTLACGATQSGFGRTGTVDWQTTKKTTSFTAVNGEGYFVDTGGGIVTVTLPASPGAGNIVYVKDYDGNFATNKCTIARNGSNIRGATSNIDLEKDNSGAFFIYVDATEGWQVFFDGSDLDAAAQFTVATGGTVVVSGDYKTHVFTGPGTFCVTQKGGGDAGKIDYVVVAGGGGGGAACAGGGGGAGGFRESHCSTTSGPYTASPLASSSSLPIAVAGYPVTVGAGGGGGGLNSTSPGCTGSNSVFAGTTTITSNGGGSGGGNCGAGSTGGSGGGGAHYNQSGGAGNTPPTTPAQGTDGADSNSPNGSGPGDTGGGGGGAGGAALFANSTPVQGGPGVTTAMVTATYGVSTPTPGRGFASGGGSGTRDRGDGATPGQGAPNPNSPPNGGLLGGGGSGGYGPYPNPSSQATGGSGTTNTGGGGGGGSRYSPGTARGAGGAGGSGIVMIRYKFQ